MGVLDITCSSVISPLHNKAELENYLIEKEAKYHKVCANRYESQELQSVIDNQKSISEADSSTEPSSSSLSHSFRNRKVLVLTCVICSKEDL